MLDKNGDDGDESDQVEGVRITENDHLEEADGELNEEQMLDVAEKCFMQIAEAIIARGLAVRGAFKK